MVDFNDLIGDDDDINYSDYLECFDSLDPETTHTELRPSQIDSLKLLQKRRSERDTILKVSTGGGKTTVGLLYLYSHMKEKEKPVVFLCPTVQLVSQVLKEATRLGIKAVEYSKGERHPPVSGISAQAVIVCTYDKLFNAKSTFKRSDVNLIPCAIILDDAHSGIERIKKQFSVTVDSDHSLYQSIMKKLKGPLSVDYGSVFERVETGDPTVVFEVPYWIWKEIYVDIRKMFNTAFDDPSIMFSYPNIRDSLRWCRCIISSAGVEVQPNTIPINIIPAYYECDNRLIMSATLAEDSVLVRDLAFNLNSAMEAVRPPSDRGLGERMVLAPSLVHRSFDREWVMNLAKDISVDYNVVVLCSTQEDADQWSEYGALTPMGEEVEVVVEELKDKEGKTSFAVFTQRYDGVDLADSACRILILDGIPRGEGIVERHDYEKSIFNRGPQNKVIFKIEQGMGRAVRSHVDYSVVILAGPEIANYVAKHDVQSKMSLDTQLQIKLALNLVESSISSEDDTITEISKREFTIKDMINKCLKRDLGWKKFYNKKVRENKTEIVISINQDVLKLSEAERMAFILAQGNQFIDAATQIRSKLNNVSIDDRTYGWSLSGAANYLYEVNSGDALEIQRSAHFKNKSVQPPTRVVYRSKKLEADNFCDNILSWAQSFENSSGIFAAIESLKIKIDFSNGYKVVEKAIDELSEMLGAKGERPDNDYSDGGPDNLWFWGEYAIIIEVKNEKTSSLFKSDSGQMSNSLNWFKERYPHITQIKCMTVTNATTVGKESFYPEGTLVLNTEKINLLIGDITNFYETLIRDVLVVQDASKVLSRARSYGLSPTNFFDKYLIELKNLKKK